MRRSGVRILVTALMPYKDIEKRRSYARDWMSNRRTTWFHINGPCVDCGSWSRLELDHVNRTDKISHRIWSWCQEKQSAELAKCVVRCHSCHVKKTWTIDFPKHHGLSMYDIQRCRCEICRFAKSEKNKKYREQVATRKVN